jgi:hypothetical protein
MAGKLRMLAMTNWIPAFAGKTDPEALRQAQGKQASGLTIGGVNPALQFMTKL